MEKGEMVAESMATDPDHELHFDWTPYLSPDLSKAYPTSVSNDLLNNSMEVGLKIEKGVVLQKQVQKLYKERIKTVSYTHLRAHET